METPREIKLENVDNVDQLKEYLNQFVDCYDKKLKMFLKVRSMILALNEKINEPKKSPDVNTIRVTDLLNNDIDKNLKQKYMKTNQDPSLSLETENIGTFIQTLMTRFCNKGLDLSNFPVYKEEKPKPMFQTLLLEIMLNNFVTKKILEDTNTTPAGSPATTVEVQYSPSSPFSSVGTEILDYMQSPMQTPMLVTGSTIGNLVDDSNTPLTITDRNEKITGKINDIGSVNYHIE